MIVRNTTRHCAIALAILIAAPNCFRETNLLGEVFVSRINWRDALKQPPEWYGNSEAVRIADNLLVYQRNSGGWPKNIDMAGVLSEGQRADILDEKRSDDSTIDNGATYSQLIFLARVFSAKQLPRHRELFLRGLDYLLRAQYDNGGWPQYFPLKKGYYQHITF